MEMNKNADPGSKSSLVQNSNVDLKDHWNKAYQRNPIEKLGWYENTPDPSLFLIEKCNLDHTSSILNVGAGSTTLIDYLLKLGYQNLIVNDISPTALDLLKARIGDENQKVQWIEDDLTNPVILPRLDPVDLWHDRAVMHFFTSPTDQSAYFNLLKKIVKPSGYVIIAAFNLDGATKCSGLPVHRYSEQMIASHLGEQFVLKDSFDHLYTMSSGDTRSYIYTLYQRK